MAFRRSRRRSRRFLSYKGYFKGSRKKRVSRKTRFGKLGILR